MTALAGSSRMRGLPRSGIRALMECAAVTPGAVRLEIGDPDFSTYVRPGGAFYVMVDVPGRSDEFARALLAERGVAVTPGSAFGEGGEGMVRVSLAASEDAIRTGLRRLGDAVEEASR